MSYDVLGIGNAIVDILAEVPDSFLHEHNLPKASMQLVDENAAEKIYSAMPKSLKKSGGSAANTIAGIASFGGKTAFIGKVRNDELGQIFAHDLKSLGVHYETTFTTEGPSTANCLISVTPDAQRTMATYLGATLSISDADIDQELIAKTKVTYIEGYLWDTPNAKNAIRKSIQTARANARKVAFTLSDTFCVERHREEFLELLKDGVDILFANEAELLSLTQQNNFELALQKMLGLCEVTAITRSANGSVILTENRTITIAAQKNLSVIDTTGAGDLYAAGFLYGYTQGKTLITCGEWGTIAASHIIQQLGARASLSLSSLIAAA
jgi:sugar/nucleoside kinase (ribokinase family)